MIHKSEVHHNILLSKLEFFGITGRANKLIKLYLNDISKSINKEQIFQKLFLGMGKSKTRSLTGLNFWTIIFSSLHS